LHYITTIFVLITTISIILQERLAKAKAEIEKHLLEGRKVKAL
jgi:hypothetical protein